jgi:hypothetical protein
MLNIFSLLTRQISQLMKWQMRVRKIWVPFHSAHWGRMVAVFGWPGLPIGEVLHVDAHPYVGEVEIES